jgi:FkbM family methyltransferase
MNRPSTALPSMIRAAIWWNRYGIKGRGAVTRMIGQRWSGPEFFIETRHKGLLSVDAPNLDMYASIHNGGGAWEPHVMTTCDRLLRPGDVYYDIGSNTGLFAIDAAKSVPGLKIFAFEPQPTLAKHIRRSIEANGLSNIQLLEMLLGQEDGEKKFYLTSHSIHASLVPREKNFRELVLPMHTIDGLIASGRIEPPDIIKLDVEGAERLVLEGGRRTFKTLAPSVVFEADENMSRMNVTTQDLFDTLAAAAAYDFYKISPNATLTKAVPPHELGNYVALAPRHRDRLA